MRMVKQFGWVYYIGDDGKLVPEKVGKWMYFFDDKQFVVKICNDAVMNNIVVESKHSDEETGVACFYLNCDDIAAHKRVISYFIDNNLIRRTKAGRLYNISFKLDSQTIAHEYGEDFHSEIKLSKFVDLTTGDLLI